MLLVQSLTSALDTLGLVPTQDPMEAAVEVGVILVKNESDTQWFAPYI